MSHWRETLLGPLFSEGQCRFCVWAPHHQRVELRIVAPRERIVTLEHDERGYHRAMVEGVEPGALYFYRMDGQKERPDPASRFQPHGVHGPSQVMDSRFAWQDQQWRGIGLKNYILYEVHVGTFTPEGTFDAMITYLDELKELGVTALELMPVNQFPGEKNWGYDGVQLFAVQNSYGGPEGLKRLVNACHGQGLAVVLDVVYNHLGPEGNCLGDYAPYFTERYKTPWGPALNFDGPHSDEVRRFFIENALYWVKDFHVDALRLDAVHAILDRSPRPFLEDLATVVHEQAQSLKRQIYLMPESATNDARIIRHGELGGYGLDAQWNDDFHHALHVLLTNERGGYYQDYGTLQNLAKAFREGFVYSGEYSSYRQHRHGVSSRALPGECFVVFSQNHDQVGNRMRGERLSQLVSFERQKVAAGLVILSPFLPLLFMGEEYGETAPFPYFVSHSDPDLIEAVRNGRREEFGTFEWEDSPDPQDEAIFWSAKLNHALRLEGTHRILWNFYREMIRLRKGIAPLSNLSKETQEVLAYEQSKILFIRRWGHGEEAVAIFNLGECNVSEELPLTKGQWQKRLDSAEQCWNGPGSSHPKKLTSEGKVSLDLTPEAFVLFARSEES